MRKKKRWSRIGWLGKNMEPIRRLDWDGEIETDIYYRRGQKDYWGDCQWPPRKVKVTVEEVD